MNEQDHEQAESDDADADGKRRAERKRAALCLAFLLIGLVSTVVYFQSRLIALQSRIAVIEERLSPGVIPADTTH